MKYLKYSVFLRLFCIIIMLCKSVPVMAGNSFPGCLLSNPCDCECDSINETWPSSVKTFKGKQYPVVNNEYDGNCCCPPYNKIDGRSNCLLQKAPAGMFNMLYFSICAEESPESDYFDPKIRYRGQACNIACWPYKGDLTGDGECTMLATPNGLPTVRLCARTVSPADPLHNAPQDEGYTPDIHLDFEGYFVDDNPLSNGGYDANGNPLSTPNPLLQSPKVCIFYDPSLIDTCLNVLAIKDLGALVVPILVGLSQSMGNVGEISPADALLTLVNPDVVDTNPVSEPLAHSSGVSPMFEFIILLLEAGANISAALAGWLDGLPDYLRYTPAVAIMEGTLRLINIVSTDVGVPFLKFIGTLNRVVVGSFGCVNIPLGPFPPPYCTPLQHDLSIPGVYPICATTVLNNGSTTLSQSSTNYDPCKNPGAVCPPPIPYGLCVYPSATGERNNFIHNSIRVGFNDYKPLCQSTTTGTAIDLTLSGKCINIIGNTSAGLMHAATNSKDILPLCSNPTGPIGEGTCVSSTYLSSQCQAAGATKPWYCTNGIRVTYSVGTASTPQDYFDESLPDCGGLSSQCQVMWGVNLGAFSDLVVAFPPQETTNNTAVQQSSSVTLPDIGGAAHTFYAAIPRITTQIASGTTTAQETDQICVYESNPSAGGIVTVGCKPRPIAPKPTIYACDGSLCTSTFFYPKMITSLSIPAGNGQNDSTQGAVGPVTDNTAIASTVNLAGFNYSAYGTDSTFAQKPFSGSHAIINSSTIYGNYLNNIPPYNTIGQNNTGAIYLNGVEYLNSKYQFGASWLCLSGYKVDDCITGETRQNCVLANLLNSNVMSCSVFRGILVKYTNIDVCNPSNTRIVCDHNNPIDQYNGYNNNIVNILTCSGLDNNGNSNGITSVCYDYGAQNGRLCGISEDAANRIVPSPSYGSTLLKSFVANVDYYDYKPGVSSSPNAQASLTSQTNSNLISNVALQAQNIYNAPVTTVYSPTICFSNSAPIVQNPASDFAQGMMSACTSARGANDQLTAICTATQAAVTDHTSTLYAQLVSACNSATSSMPPILTDQFNTQLLQQMQIDAISAKTILSNFIKLINNFASNPTLINNITSSAQSIYSSTDVNTYPTPISKINAICTQTSALFMTTDPQTQAQVVDPTLSPLIYTALGTACTTAQNAIVSAQSAALATLNTTLQGFTQYSVNPPPANNGVLTSIDGSSTVGYIEPNLETMTVRNRTDLENGLCITVPQPTCAATTAGNATWTQAAIGAQSQGTCLAGYSQVNTSTPLLVYCLLNRDTKTVSLDPIINSACAISGVSNVIITQNFSTMTSSNGQNQTPYPNTITAHQIGSGAPMSQIALSCPAGKVCTGTSTVNFNLQGASNLQCFNINSINVNDYLKVVVNGTLAYAAGGGTIGTIYDYVSGGGVLPTNMPDTPATWVSNGLSLNIAPLLTNGANSIVYTLYLVNSGALNYSMIYGMQNDLTSPCPTLSNISTTHQSNLRVYDTDDPAFGFPVQNTASTSTTGRIGYSTGSLYCDHNPCSGNMNVTFSVGNIANIQSFKLSYIDIKDWMNVFVNGTLVYAANGFSISKYDITRPNPPYTVYPASQNGLPQNLTTDGGDCNGSNPYPNTLCNTNGWGLVDPGIDITPYLKAGPNNIVFNFYSFYQGKFAYTFDYVLTKP